MQFTKIALPFALLGLACANDIKFYYASSCSYGEYIGCYNIDANICCAGNGAVNYGISISKGPLDFATMWAGGGCTTPGCSAGGEGTLCCISVQGVSLTGGSYSTESQGNCTSSVAPNVIGYSSEQGTWEIHKEDDEEAFAQMLGEYGNIKSVEKTNWLQNHGAVEVPLALSAEMTVQYASFGEEEEDN